LAPEGTDRLIERLVVARKLLVALDFDGTLAPLVPNPDDSRLAPGALAVLRRLAQIDRVQLALVSGRPALDLARLATPPEGTWLVGSHGAERGEMRDSTAAIEPIILSERRQKRLAAITTALRELAESGRSVGQAAAGAFDSSDSLARGSGAWVEPKPYAAVFHTRPMVDRTLATALEAEAARLGKALGGHVLPGKMVVEVSVLPAGKAAALARLRAAGGADRLVFAGDDTTDELALRTIHPPDLGIKVGAGATAAELRLPGPAAVVAFLDRLATALTKPPAGR
jgi:trehalose 6-phosphate phosphatase